MRRFAPLLPSRALSARVCSAIVIAAGLAFTTIYAQVPGRNVNMVAGTSWPGGDPHLQRQNEPSIAASTRNPLHLLAGSNDYRTVDVPFPADGDAETGDAWLGLFKSFDGGQRWISDLLPGYPQDQSEAGMLSPLKAYQAGADPVVRAGTNGLLYYSGLVFDRVENGKSGIFLARFIDNNNVENRDSIAYLGTSLVATSSGVAFLDKPWMAVDIPRAGAQTCFVSPDNVLSMSAGAVPWKGKGKGQAKKNPGTPLPPGTQRIPAGAVYVAYSSITGEGDALKSEILLKRSTDCGSTWSPPIRVSRPEDPINQGASITIDPRSGSVYIAWRRFTPSATTTGTVDLDAMMVARLPYGGAKFDPPGNAYGFSKAQGQRVSRKLDKLFEHKGNKDKDTKPEELGDVPEFDQGSSTITFRTNAYPTMAADAEGRVYIAWTQRGFPAPDATNFLDGARIMLVTTRDGRTFTTPQAVDDEGQLGHQLMPSLTFAGGRLMLVYYDLRQTAAQHHGRFAREDQSNSGLRHTIDIRAAMAPPGDVPVFAPSVRVSEYLMGYNPAKDVVQQLQHNPPNFPMFRQGTTPFMGDYIDIAAAPAFVPIGNGQWAYNTAETANVPVFHAAWTDNRDVRPPTGSPQDWTQYAPVNLSQAPGTRTSVFDGSTVPACVPGNAGSRNQNIYTARVTAGLLAGSPGNTKPLSPTLQRAFVVFATNATDQQRMFRMSIRNQPPGGRASFEQFDNGQPPLVVLDMSVPRRSTASRSVYVTSSDPDATIAVDVFEIADPAGGVEPLGLASTVLLNPDVENPDVENPDVENQELYNPDVENPDVENPDVENIGVATPDVENPDVENPDVENPDVENVDVANPDVENPDVENPDVENPDVENPDVENPDVENQAVGDGEVADVTWTVSNNGNTTAAYNVNVFLASDEVPAGVKTQLILYKTYRTPVGTPNGCQLGFQVSNVLVDNILNPVLLLPSSNGVPDQNSSSDKNATMWLGPGEEGRVTLRVISDDLPPNFTFVREDGTTKDVFLPEAFQPQNVTLAISSQGVGTVDKAAGQTEPELVTPSGANLFFLQQPSDTQAGFPIAPPVTVQVRDNTGSPVPGATVILSLANNFVDASLAGNSAVANEAGIAMFPQLSVSAAGAGFRLVATAAAAGAQASGESIAFNVTEPLQVLTNELSPGTAGLPYQATLISSGGVGSGRSWTLEEGGKLPTGLTLSPAGVISGTVIPLARGDFDFTVLVADQAVPAHTAARALTISIGAVADLSIDVSGGPNPAQPDADITYTISVANAGPSAATDVVVNSGFSSGFTFVAGDEGCVPGEAGVTCAIGTLSPNSGTEVSFTVTADQPGTLNHTAVVSSNDPDPILANNTDVESTVIEQPLQLVLPPVGDRIAYRNVAYALPLAATGGVPPYSWSIVEGELPPGLTLNASNGRITGTVQEAESSSYMFAVSVDDSDEHTDTQTLCIEIRFSPESQLVITSLEDTDLTADDVIRNLLGSGISLVEGSATFTGVSGAAGTFSGGSMVLGMSSGIVIGSGFVGDAHGPNEADDTSGRLFPFVDDAPDPEHGDKELTADSNQPTYDATALEFKFVPTGSQVRFRYIFASEEYNELVGSEFNDTFAFYLTGPDGKRRNVAVVPGSNAAVTVNTINGGNPFGSGEPLNPEFYRNNDPDDPGASIGIATDGLTVVLTLIADVEPGEEHSMKLAIADAGDADVDSLVFMQAASFSSVEICNNGIDDDGDDLADGDDPDCQACPEIGNPDLDNPDIENPEIDNPPCIECVCVECDFVGPLQPKPPGGGDLEPLGDDGLQLVHLGEEMERRPLVEGDRRRLARPATRRIDL